MDKRKRKKREGRRRTGKRRTEKRRTGKRRTGKKRTGKRSTYKKKEDREEEDGEEEDGEEEDGKEEHIQKNFSLIFSEIPDYAFCFLAQGQVLSNANKIQQKSLSKLCIALDLPGTSYDLPSMFLHPPLESCTTIEKKETPSKILQDISVPLKTPARKRAKQVATLLTSISVPLKTPARKRAKQVATLLTSPEHILNRKVKEHEKMQKEERKIGENLNAGDGEDLDVNDGNADITASNGFSTKRKPTKTYSSAKAGPSTNKTKKTETQVEITINKDEWYCFLCNEVRLADVIQCQRCLK
ncbi:hypothetical protein QE152_g26032 [Popillia japonica]|uniref:RanBP2-type domain-containing protein n=1 Tax=Popillia japonica TaxID=7064 RepID=A0AAW1JYG9_POPJA